MSVFLIIKNCLIYIVVDDVAPIFTHPKNIPHNVKLIIAVS